MWGGGGGGDQVKGSKVCDHLQVMLCLCIFVVLVFVFGRYCVMCVVFEVMQSSTCRVFECCCLLLDLLGVASNVGIMEMSLCRIPHLVFTRGRASIVLTFSSWRI